MGGKKFFTKSLHVRTHVRESTIENELYISHDYVIYTNLILLYCAKGVDFALANEITRPALLARTRLALSTSKTSPIGTARLLSAFSISTPITPSRVHLATRRFRVEEAAFPQAALSSQARNTSPLVRSKGRVPRRAGTQSFAQPNEPGKSTAVVCRRWQPRPRPRARARPRPAPRARAASARPRRSARR